MGKIKQKKNMRKEKIINLLRLAKKAKKLSFGRNAVERSIKKNETKLIFSGKNSNNFIRKRSTLCESKGIHISYIFADDELADIFDRRKLTLVSVDDMNFFKGMKQALDNYKE